MKNKHVIYVSLGAAPSARYQMNMSHTPFQVIKPPFVTFVVM